MVQHSTPIVCCLLLSLILLIVHWFSLLRMVDCIGFRALMFSQEFGMWLSMALCDVKPL